MGLKWTNSYCSNATFVLKIDDDVILNAKYLLDYLEKQEKATKSFFCITLSNVTVVRETSYKWHLTAEEYKQSTLPTYCKGVAYVLTKDLGPMLLDMSFKIDKIYLEDAYIGILSQFLDVSTC